MKTLTRILIVSLLFGCGSQAPQEAVSAPRKENAAPDFNLPSTRGKSARLSDLKGKVVLLDFWATWCPPCRMSTPELVKLHKKLKGKDFVILGISLDEDRSAVSPYLRKANVEHLVLYGGDSTVQRDYNIRAIPTFFLLDKSGKVVKNYAGYYPGMSQEWERDIATLLN